MSIKIETLALAPKYFKIPLLLCGVVIVIGILMNVTDTVSPGILQTKMGGSKQVVMTGNAAIWTGVLAAVFILLTGYFENRKK